MSALEKLTISKVDDVTLWRRGDKYEGSLTLTQHHLIFSYLPPSSSTEDQPDAPPPRPREIWITYPMVSYCTYRPAPPISRQQPSIRIRCRDFTFVAFHFPSEAKARDTYDTVRNLSCRLRALDGLYAFSYRAHGPEKKVNGWAVYNPMEEFRRQGVGKVGQNRGWRVTDINKDYQYSPTYPSVLVVPAVISDNVLNYAGKYRSRARIPVLTYLHPVNECSITRSSQPQVGLRGNRSVQDEKLVGAICATSKMRQEQVRKLMPSADAPNGHVATGELQDLEDETIAKATAAQSESMNRPTEDDGDDSDEGPLPYGAQQRNLIVDARPTLNAIVMQASGKGSENMDHYPFATKAYLGIDNIHVMRHSLSKVIDALKDSDVTPLPPDRERLMKSGWLKHISNILDGAALISRQVGIHHSHVLIHCSDGWDRTGQLSALSQLCLDPYYRTLEGFIVLVEKDFVSFGHMFRNRSGFLGSEKWFEIDNERIGGQRDEHSPSGGRRVASGNAIENAFSSAKDFFQKHTGGRDSSFSYEAEGEMMQSYDGSSPNRSGSGTPNASKKNLGDVPSSVPNVHPTDLKEISPVFHQFLDATYQLLHQHPTRFEFNERFLRRLFYQLYSCQYGTFLFNSEKERADAKISEKTKSVWDYFLARKEQFTNEQYDGGLVDDNTRGKERMLFPSPAKVRWWAELFGRTDDEMNGQGIGMLFKQEGSTLEALETSQHSFGPGVADLSAANHNGQDHGVAVASNLSKLSLADQDPSIEHEQEAAAAAVSTPTRPGPKEQMQLEVE